MKTSFQVCLTLSFLQITAPLSLVETANAATPVIVTDEKVDTTNFPNLKTLDPAVHKLALTIVSTGLNLAADLADQGLLGDSVVMSVAYGQVLEMVMTEETFATLPSHVQEYFKKSILLELGIISQINNLAEDNPATIISINEQLKASKDALLPLYPKTAPVFNNLETLIGATMEQYNLVEIANHYRDNNISMIYLSAEQSTSKILRYLADHLNNIILSENSLNEEPQVYSELVKPANLDLDKLEKPVYHFILTLAATGMSVAADFAEEGLLKDPLIKAIAYGQVLKALLTEETIATLPANYQAYFKRILQIEEETAAALATLNSEDPVQIQAEVELREEKQALLVNEFPFASAVFNDMHVLVATIIQKFDLLKAARIYRENLLSNKDYTPEQQEASILRHMSNLLLIELDKFEKQDITEN